MQRNYQTNYSSFKSHSDLKKHTAFHEAGHAASIYLGNKKKKLPPVFFQIKISHNANSKNPFFAKVIDGRLIQNLPIAGLDNIHDLTKEDRRNYQCAYEADIINLLVGPLAEAKYVSIKDDEAFNFNLVNIHSLNYYGGSSDIENAYSYLQYFIASENRREEKMMELFTQAYLFIENKQNWKCILNLAHYILDSEKDILSCEEAIEIFDNCIA
ncbi:MAG: hypothetical protein ACKE51_02865 [Methylococcaceae bacterium]